MNVTLRRSAYATSGKKSDITAALAEMRATPEFLAASETAPELRDVTPRAPRQNDISDFWNDLRDRRPIPPRDALRASDIASRWPDSILFRRGRQPGYLQPDSTFAMALRAHRSATSGRAVADGVEVSAMLAEWTLSVAREAAEAGAPVRDASKFNTPRGPVEYNVVGLPFGDDAASVDYVLCSIKRADAVT